MNKRSKFKVQGSKLKREKLASHNSQLVKPDLSVNIAGIKLKNPVIAASGTSGYGEELTPYIDLTTFGAIIAKGLSLKPREGNPPPRIVETQAGLINAIGLQNIGVKAFIRDKLPVLRSYNVPVIANIFGERIEDYCRLAEELEGAKYVAGIELNISCPNVEKGCIEFGRDPKVAYKLVKEVRQATKLPIITKLSPNVNDIKEMAKGVEEGGTDAISLINTITAMAIDIERRRPKLCNVIGGLSGPAIRPIAVRMVWEVAQVVNIPVIGIGGIMRHEDALEFAIAGATAIQIGTANFIDPSVGLRVLRGIEGYLLKNGINRFLDIVGSLKVD